jgi:hypothetical protein
VITDIPLENLIPKIAMLKLQSDIDLKTASEKEILQHYSHLMWKFEAAFTDLSEHGGLEWKGPDND